MLLSVQGGSIGYALLSMKPDYNDKISVLIVMGPVTYIDWFQPPFLKAMASVRNDKVSLLMLFEGGAPRVVLPREGTSPPPKNVGVKVGDIVKGTHLEADSLGVGTQLQPCILPVCC